MTLRDDSLVDDDLWQRCERFLAGDRTLEHAADCGLLAFAVPEVFGGFGIPTEIRERLLLMLAARPLVVNLREHWAVCDAIIQHGTYAQYDLFLPQLAAGKRIGVLAHPVDAMSGGSISYATKNDDGFQLWAKILIRTLSEAASLVYFRCSLDGAMRSFIADRTLLPRGRMGKAGMARVRLRECLVPLSALLGEGHHHPDLEAWRAIRWNSAPSES
jgi:hypothetical protein